MELLPKNRLLEVPPGAVQEIRKLHGLDKPGRLVEAVNILVDWIQKEDHIIKKDFSREYLEKSLLSCKGSVEKAKKQIDRLCTMRTMLPKFFNKTNVKIDLEDILDVVCLLPLSKITKDYYRVLIIKINSNNFTSESFMQYYRFIIILTEYFKVNDYVNGFMVICDYRQVNLLDLMTKLNTVELQQFLSILIEGFGARLKSINILTDSKAIDLLIKIFKQFVSEKIGNRVYVNPTLEDLHMFVPKEILPVEYGGKERSVEELYKDCIEDLSSDKHVEYLKMMSKACTDETKRNSVKFNEEYMGMPGAFRNLSVD